MTLPAAALEVPENVAAQARSYAGSATAPYHCVVRGRIIRDAIAGWSNEENARRNSVRVDTVRKARRRAMAAKSATAAFEDAPRSGRPARIALETRAALIAIACERPTPELEKQRVQARMQDARTAKKMATLKETRARARQRRQERRQQAAEKRGQQDKARRARKERKAAEREMRKAAKERIAAESAEATATADAARAAKGIPATLSSLWTHKTLQAELARQTGETMSESEIGRTLRCGGLRPHRVRMWLHSPDPEFRAKVKAICDLYLNPPEGAVVLSVDEKTGMQARADLHPIHAAEQGPVRREFEYVRHGTSTLIAAFDIRTGEVFGRCWRRTAEGLIRFLEEVAKKHPTGDVYIVWDNLNVHYGVELEAFNTRQGERFHFVYTPRHASWVNQVEIWFSILQRRVLKHGSFSSPADLEAAVKAFIQRWNKVEGGPFRWRFRGNFAPGLP